MKMNLNDVNDGNHGAVLTTTTMMMLMWFLQCTNFILINFISYSLATTHILTLTFTLFIYLIGGK